MNLVDQWKVGGPVRTIRSELTEWDLAKEQWQAPRRVTMAQFRPDGCISEMENHNPNGSISRSRYSYDEAGRLLESIFQLDEGPLSKTVCRYDESGRLVQNMVVDGNGAEREAEICSYDLTGRKTKVEFISEPRHPAACGTMYGVEGAQQGYGAKGVVSITTLFDDREQPCDVLFQDKDREIILRVILTRDSAGRLVKEESRSGDRQPLPIAQIFENAPADERVAAEAVLAQLFNPQKAIWSTTYRYDDRSCQIERCTWIGGLKQSRTTWEYDEHDNVIREIKQETVGGGLQTDESGKLQFINEKLSNHGVRYEYKYDSHGNWTGRVVSMRYETNLDLQRSNTERREINYYPST